MKIYNQREAQQRINQLARADKPFVFIISYNQQQAYIEEAGHVDSSEMLYAFPAINNVPKDEVINKNPVEWRFEAPNRAEYQGSIEYVKANQRNGNCYLANLTCKVPIHTNLTMRDIFLRSTAKYRCWVKDKFVCFSPEIFVRIDGETIHSFPMKGTIAASVPNAANVLMNNAKEAAEHATIVDLIRNDLSIVATKVSVEKYRYIDKLTTNKGDILQTSSEIVGQLLPHYRANIGDLLFSLLPAGSITGAPKSMTTRIIAEAERHERGFYTGIMGHWANGNLDSAVMIRFIDTDGKQLFYKAGGGITAQSNDDDEYNEMIEKVYVPIY